MAKAATLAALVVFCGMAVWGNAAAAAEPGPANKAFAESFVQWKALLADLRKQQEEFAKAADAQKPAIEARFNELVKQGSDLQPKVIDLAQKAYAEDPKQNPELAEFLLAILAGEVRHDEYEHAYELVRLLAQGGVKEDAFYSLAGQAAFATNHFDEAKKFYQTAMEKNAMDQQGAENLRQAEQYKAAWDREEKIREAESKADDLPRVLLTTSKGDIEIELFENEAPNSVANFISLVEKKFYDGTVFHRVLEGFMAQGGDPTGTGTGGPGYHIPCECYRPDARWHYRGSLSMAHAGRDTGGSQFFLTFVPTPHLNGRHTCFGRVIKGLDVLAKIQRIDPQQPNSRVKPDKIVEAKVLRKRNHPYEPKKA